MLKAGELMADGPCHQVLTSAKLSNLFETPLQLLEANGYRQVLPDSTKRPAGGLGNHLSSGRCGATAVIWCGAGLIRGATIRLEPARITPGLNAGRGCLNWG